MQCFKCCYLGCKFMCLFLNFLSRQSLFFVAHLHKILLFFNALFSAAYANNCFKLLQQRCNQLTLEQFNSLCFD